ncbi:ATP-binding protein [Acidobacteria bacterium AH-259-D05]|nr:ATP-binding protein [Acidobacteria bacterium AH-259-D05]
MSLGLFTRTLDNRLIFHLFELLLSGVIALVILRAWSNRSRNTVFAMKECFLPAGGLLSLSLGYAVVSVGNQFFFHADVAEMPLILSCHLCITGAWAFIALQYWGELRPGLRYCWGMGLGVASLSVLPLLIASHLSNATAPFEVLARILDWVALPVLAVTIYRLLGLVFPARRILVASLSLFWLATVLHLGSAELISFPIPANQLLFWNLEQFTFSAALFLLALAIGEMSTNLFDAVFIRIQIAFLILASVIILVVTGTERAEYLTELRNRSRNLATYFAAGLESGARRGQTLSETLSREDLLVRMATDFGNLPELAAIHIIAPEEVATVEVDSTGQILKSLTPASRSRVVRFQDQDEYILIDSISANWRNGAAARIELYGLKEYVDRFTRRRTVLIFTLFTGAVALATFMIGLVVHHAQSVLQKQEEEIRARQEELAMASKMKVLGELAGTVAHEVNTPATTILSRASFLLNKWKKAGLPREMEEDLVAIKEQAQRVARITTSLLGFSRRYVFEISSISICEVIKKSVSLVEEDLEQHAINLTIFGCPSAYPVAGDPNALVQVFVNLLRNAIDATPKGSNVSIEVGTVVRDQPRVHIRLSDEGVGIPQKHLSRIFVPFFTTKQMGKGTGLGLSVVYGIISEHRGSIKVESQEGQGTTFHIELPSKS